MAPSHWFKPDCVYLITMILINIQVFILRGSLMIRHSAVALLPLLFCLFSSLPAHAAVQLYTGQMDILVTSGKSCDGVAGKHDVTMVVTVADGEISPLEGYFTGEGISLGHFSGTDPAHLDVRYPFHDEQRAAGHVLTILSMDGTVVAELRDRHAEETSEDCNFDKARLELVRDPTGDPLARQRQLAGLYNAQLNRSQALAISTKSGYPAALPYFEKALSLAESSLPVGSEQLTSYIIGLATCYIWMERFDQFNQLFDAKISVIPDESVRSIFSAFRIRPLMSAGRSALAKDEFDAALKNFEEAYKLQPQSSEAVIAVVSVYLRRDQYGEAISFLERTVSILKSEADRREVHTAMAMILSKKAQKEDKNGRGDEAEQSLKRAMELDPGSVYYLIALARQRHKSGSLHDAESLLDRGVELFKDDYSQKELQNARDRIMQTEMILKKIRKVGS
jgi:tetratricopeptide (TPR) repeat protein